MVDGPPTGKPGLGGREMMMGMNEMITAIMAMMSMTTMMTTMMLTMMTMMMIYLCQEAA